MQCSRFESDSPGRVQYSHNYIPALRKSQTLAITGTVMSRKEERGLVPEKPAAGLRMAPTDVPSNVTEDFYFSEAFQPSPELRISHSRFKGKSNPKPTPRYHGHSSQALTYVKELWSRRERRWEDGSAVIDKSTVIDEIDDLLGYYTRLSLDP
ncbi:hypothetical protein B0H14DRAFT_2611127 [Mycena olivaceomarginata]|nr:hypothetical protein B0H14DRAFT_2611127 [Mycena olivaceomarginata]